MERERGEDGVEGIFLVRKELFVLKDISVQLKEIIEWKVNITVEESGRRVGGSEVRDSSRKT